MKLVGMSVIYALTQHFIGCCWLIVGRIDPNRTNYWVIARYTGPNSPVDRKVSDIEKYIDAQIFVMSTMNGLGYGNIVPTTNLEWFADTIISITGSSVYAGIFSELAVVFFNANKLQAENEKMEDQAKQFADQV